MITKKRIIHKDEGLVWFFRKTPSGKFVPAPNNYPEGFPVKEALEVLNDLQEGLYDGHPAGDHYVPCECRFIKTRLP